MLALSRSTDRIWPLPFASIALQKCCPRPRRHSRRIAIFLPGGRIDNHGGRPVARGARLARTLVELSPLELLEQAAAILRTTPLSAWNYYFAGAAPLLVAVIYSVARASVHPVSAEGIVAASGILTVLFLWMSWTNICFVQCLRAQLEGAGEGPSRQRSLWMAASFQGTKLIILPITLLAVFPFAWSVAFYGNFNALAQRANPFRESARMASLWGRQNWTALALAAAFALVVFLNLTLLLAFLPILARMFSGYENEFTRNPAAMLNWTFAVTAFGGTWIIISPLVQAMYVVRCFKGESIGSGADLLAALRRLVIGCGVLLLTVSAAHARPLTAPELDSKIRHTLQSPDYAWQNPEPAESDAPRWVDDALKLSRRAGHLIRIGIEWLGAWLRNLLHSHDPAVQAGTPPPATGLRWAVYATLGVIALLAVLILRKALARSQGSRDPAAIPGSPIDLNVDVLASELPEQEWLRLAREALDRGDLRAALRAGYLANLAWLGSAGLVAVSRFKTNRDYEKEVRLRSRSDEITSLLKSNRQIFESAWYGDQDKTPEDVDRMRRNLVRMRELAHA